MAGTLFVFSVFCLKTLWQMTGSKRLKIRRLRIKRPIQRLIRGGRNSQLKSYCRIATDVMSDVQAALEPPGCQKHARSFLPILADVTRRGLILLSQQTGTHRVTAPERERELKSTVDKLISLERKLKSLPKPTVTVEEVLLGKFE
jgi:hypothetical protein